jgi:hypothetical protein
MFWSKMVFKIEIHEYKDCALQIRNTAIDPTTMKKYALPTC